MGDITILGAGLAGTIMYSVLNKKATVIEKNSPNANSHHAVLHFRNPELGRVLDLEFKKIKVQKSIVYQGKHYDTSNLFFSNQYSLKILDTLTERSIRDLDEKERWVTTEATPYNHIIKNKRLMTDGLMTDGALFNHTVKHIAGNTIFVGQNKEPQFEIQADIIINTLPMPTVLNLIGERCSANVKFEHSEIWVYIADLPEGLSEVYQTIYYPDVFYPIYRATLDKNKLIIEATEKCIEGYLKDVLEDFGLEGQQEITSSDFTESKQQFGKIKPLPENVRQSILNTLTVKYGIYSIGRFALWKNVRADDIYKDALMIKELIKIPKDAQRYLMRKEFVDES